MSLFLRRGGSMPARLFDQLFALSVGGVDLTPYVQSIDIERDYGEDLTADGWVRRLPTDTMSLTIEVFGPTDVITGREQAPAPVPEPDHQFVQDPVELPARLCRECSMWPDHHNHHVARGIRCVCQVCRPEDQPGGLSSLPGDHTEFGRAAGEGAHP